MVNYIFLLLGIIYTTILPGFLVVGFLFPNLKLWEKIPLCFLLSVIISTIFSYLAALVFGLSRETLLACFIFFVILLLVLVWKKGLPSFSGLQELKREIIFGILVYLIFFTALLPGIFTYKNGYFVMSGPNWQDTAMHLSIIESLAQGNFPPQAPYFSGQPLSYYYFSDLHAAIINIFYGDFFPQVLVLINPFFAMTFFFSVYALSFSILKKRGLSIVAGLMAVFYSNMKFIDLFIYLFSNCVGYFRLVAENPFHLDQELFQMVPMSDYFLQNRPMMVGLPAFVLTILLLLEGVKKNKFDWKKIFLAGFITAALIKFQLFGFVVSWLFLGLCLLFKLIVEKNRLVDLIRVVVVFGFWTFLFSLGFGFSNIGSRSLISVFLQSFDWGPWQSHPLTWFFLFIFANFGPGFFIFLIGFWLPKLRRKTEVLILYLICLTLFIIPFLFKFTIYAQDMFKFFYYAVPLVSFLVVFFFSFIPDQKGRMFLLSLILFFTSLTSVNLLFHSFLNKNIAYSLADYKAGMWIRNNIPEKSVFVTLPTVHSAPADIGGRLRIISYINWPYSHGFDQGEDNVFSRASDVEKVYGSADVRYVKFRYNARYIYYGEEERQKFPDAVLKFDQNIHLKKIYDEDGIKIYEIF
ncbi:MAG: hypothetical protein KatS3mg088_176 [Patescibacteria group bacterium]|nr:MAG: hypothetical protein KatS3mg088_176 [Patescibacteria group bacterium]